MKEKTKITLLTIPSAVVAVTTLLLLFPPFWNQYLRRDSEAMSFWLVAIELGLLFAGAVFSKVKISITKTSVLIIAVLTTAAFLWVFTIPAYDLHKVVIMFVLHLVSCTAVFFISRHLERKAQDEEELDSLFR
ncbi:MAG: hypothetical protein ACLFQB_12810 [Chitinispirillaceae bacterium]